MFWFGHLHNRKKIVTFSISTNGYITPEQYIEGSGPYLEKEGFHEIGIAQRVEQFGNIAHVFTTYQAKHKLTDEKPIMRGINSIQLINDGTRWWVLNIAWSQETPESPIPETAVNRIAASVKNLARRPVGGWRS